MQSTAINTRVVDEYLEKEIERKTIASLANPLEVEMQVSHFKVILKGHEKRKWQLILGLSHPDGLSVNDRIDQSMCTLSYTSVDEAVHQILKLGRGMMLAKLDLESAFWMLPIHPDDSPLLGMKWREKIWMDNGAPIWLELHL